LKKCLFLCAVLLFLSCTAFAEGIIRSDFYLNGREEATFREAVSILPNTLRLPLSVGESELLRADVSPDSSRADELSWRLCEKNGVAEIYPAGDTCVVYALSEGEERVGISLDGGETVFVSVDVASPREVRLRSFESETEEKKTLFTEKLLSFIVRALRLCAAILISLGIVFLIKQKGGTDGEG